MDIPVTKSNNKVSKWLSFKSLGLLFLCLSAYTSASYFDDALPGIDSNQVWISQVKKGEFIRNVRAAGVLSASEIRWIAAESAGRIERVLVKPGAMVNKDTIIAELSNPQLLSQLEQAEWDLDAAEANFLALKAQMQEQRLEQQLIIKQAEMALESSILKEKAEQQLAKKQIISALHFASTQLSTKQNQSILDIRRQSLVQREQLNLAKMKAEEAQIRKFQNMVQRLKSHVEKLQVTADTDGVLQEITIEVGQRVEVGGNIARVASPDSLIAELQVQQNLVQDLNIGLPVTIDTRNGLVDGLILRIDPRVDNGNVQVDVELISDLPAGARPDLSITASITTEKIDDTLFIERPAGVTAMTKSKLFIVNDEDQIAHIRDIEFGKASVSTIQIIAGLDIGDHVVVSDMTDFQKHPSIRILQ